MIYKNKDLMRCIKEEMASFYAKEPEGLYTIHIKLLKNIVADGEALYEENEALKKKLGDLQGRHTAMIEYHERLLANWQGYVKEAKNKNTGEYKIISLTP